MVVLYTLPTCGICKMIKKKLDQKNIQYEERNLNDYLSFLQTDRAPVLQTAENIYNSPIEINNWINNQ